MKTTAFSTDAFVSELFIAPLDRMAFSNSDEGSIQEEVNDGECMADIKLLSSCFEAYYANNGYYPSLDRVNNLNWRETGLGAGTRNYC